MKNTNEEEEVFISAFVGVFSPTIIERKEIIFSLTCLLE